MTHENTRPAKNDRSGNEIDANQSPIGPASTAPRPCVPEIADLADVLAGFPPLTPQQCDRVAILLWPRRPGVRHGTPACPWPRSFGRPQA